MIEDNKLDEMAKYVDRCILYKEMLGSYISEILQPCGVSTRNYDKKLDSILEKIFFVSFNLKMQMSSTWKGYIKSKDKIKPLLRPQYKCGKYKIDFAIIRKHIKIAIELDGFAYHDRNNTQFNYERERQNYLVRQGYTILRFTWKGVTENFTELYYTTLNMLADGSIK